MFRPSACFVIGFLFSAPLSAAPGISRHPDLLWIVQPTQLSAYSLNETAFRWQFPLNDVQWLATDAATGTVWAVRANGVAVISPDGDILAVEQALPLDEDDIDVGVLDGTRRRAWLADENHLVVIDMDTYELVSEFVYEDDIDDLALNEVDGRLFVLADSELSYMDVETGAQSPIVVPGNPGIDAIAFDRYASRLWLADKNIALAMDTAGAIVVDPFDHDLDNLQHLATDGTGGAWLADNHELIHVDASGLTTARLNPFADAGNNSRIRALHAFPDGNTAWIHHNKLVRSIDANGALSVPFEVPGSKAALQISTLHVDVTSPEIAFAHPVPDIYTNNPREPFDVAMFDYGSLVDVDTLQLFLDEAPLPTQCDGDNTGAHCIPTFDLPDAYLTVTATVQDLAENLSVPAEVRFTVDTIPPEISVISPEPGLYTNQPELPVIVQLSEYASLEINDLPVSISADFRYSDAWLLHEGTNDFHFYAEDRATNWSETSRSVALDTVPPAIQVTSPFPAFATADDNVRLHGSVDEIADVTLNNETLTLQDLAFEKTLPLQDGENVFLLQARDRAGNLATLPLTVTRDITPPPAVDPVLITFDFDFAQNVNVFTGLPGAAAPGSTILIVPVTGNISIGEALQQLQFEFDVEADGSFVARVPAGFIYNVYVVDGAGNVSGGVSTAQLTEPVREGRAVGVVQGELSVDPNGAANYRIPLAVPPGAAGMQPELALLYSSAAGNGQLGVGWSLSGLSAVTRCPQDIAHEGQFRNVRYDGGDRLCLDGQRLVLQTGGYMEPGARYHTEIASFQRIRSYGGTKTNGVNGFKVEDKAGLIRYYGAFSGMPDGRIETDGSNTAMIWLLSRIADRHGNHINYEYGYQRGEYWPETIRWFNAEDDELGKVVFEYEDRPDKTLGALSNRSIRPMTRRLSRVRSLAYANSWKNVSTWLLDYEQGQASGLSRIAAIHQCAGNVQNPTTSAAKCLPLTGFAYRNGAPAWTSASHATTDFGNVSNKDYMRTVDLNLDGHLDALWMDDDAFLGNIKFKLSGETIIRSTGIESFGRAQQKNYTMFDANGDGYTDLVVPPQKDKYNVYYWNPDTGNFNATPALTFSGLTEADSGGFTPVPVDVDADGRQELIYKRGTTNGNTHAITIRWFDGSGKVVKTNWGVRRDQFIRPIEFNGDGLPDLLIDTGDCGSSPNTAVDIPPDDGGGGGGGGGSGGGSGGGADPWKDCVQTSGILINRGYGTFDKEDEIDCEILPPLPPEPCEFLVDNDCPLPIPEQLSANPYHFPGLGSTPYCNVVRGSDFRSDQPIVTDVNADGLTDVITYSRSLKQWRLWLNAVGMFVLADTRAAGDIAPGEILSSIAADVNQDGVPDLLYKDDNDQHLIYMTPYGFSNQPAKFIEGQKDVRWADVDSDGDPDLLGHEGHWFVRRLQGGKRDLLVGIINGAGERTAIAYQALSSRTPVDGQPLYQGHLSTAESEKGLNQHHNLLPPVDVVASFAVDTGTDKLIATYYTYKGLKADAGGRGALGFKEIRARNENTGIATINVHRQSWPYTGMIERSYQFIPEKVVPELPDDSEVLEDMEWPCAASIMFCDRTQTPLLNASRLAGIAPSTMDLDAAASGKMLSETVNTLSIRTSAQGAVFPFVKKTLNTESDYHSGATYRETETTFTYDDYGNATNILARTRKPGGKQHLVGTINLYQSVAGGNETHWCLGRLSRSTVTQNWSGADPVTRRSSFAYSAAPHCQLNYEKVHDMGAGSAQSQQLETFYTHDTFGNVISKRTRGWDGTDVVDRTATTTYDNSGRFPSQVTNALGHTETSNYDARFGARTAMQGPNNLTTSWQVDDFGRVVQTTAPRTALTTQIVRAWCAGSSCFDELSAYKEVKTVSTGGQTITEYDRLGRIVKTTGRTFQGKLSSQEKRYDLLGREIAVSLPHALGDPVCWAFTTYDNLNRPVRRASPASSNVCSGIPPKPTQQQLQQFQQSPPAGYAISAYAYDGLVTVMQDAEGRNTLREEHVTGWLKRVAELNGGAIGPGQIPVVRQQNGVPLETDYQYDAVGNTLAVTDAAGNTVSMSYDNRGRKTGMNDPDMGAWSYSYNAFGELVQQQDAKGQAVTLHYDALGRMTERQEPEGVTRWFYDTAPGKGIGKLARVEQYDGHREAYAYNSKGEVENVVHLVDGKTYWQHMVYDAYGRAQDVYQPALQAPTQDAAEAIDAAAWHSDFSSFATRNEYDPASGMLQRVRALNPNSNASTLVYWQRLAVDGAGRTTSWSLGNGMSEQREIDFARGVLLGQRSLSQADTAANLDLDYQWDLAGNLTQRQDKIFRSGANALVLTENYAYDALYRLDTVTRSASGLTGNATVLNHHYDAIGNVLDQRQGLGGSIGARGYLYGDAGNPALRPHAVRQASVNGALKTYAYDANGNLLTANMSGNARQVAWTSFNKPESISKGDASSTFRYTPSRMRYRQTDTAPEAQPDGSAILRTTDTLYFGAYERVADSDKVVHRYSVTADGQSIAVRELETRAETPAVLSKQRTHYLHRDHLGSVLLITDALGRKLERAAYGVWGQRIDLNGLVTDTTFNPAAGAGSAFTHAATANYHRGFTGHDTLEHLGLINMQGRIYDPEIGRFLSPDNAVQFPESTQGWNRYSYVENNPLSFNDPTGHFKWSKFRDRWLKPIVGIVAAVMTYGAVSGYLTTVIGNSMGMCLSNTPFLAMVSGGAAAGFVGGGITGGTLESAAKGAITGAIFGAIGGYYQDRWNVGRLLANSTAGGISAEIHGGEFKDGVKIAAAVTIARMGWEYTREQTDLLKARAIANGGRPARYNEWGELLTDGTRDFRYGIDSNGNLFSEKDHNWFTNSGMAQEGSGQHLYSENSWTGRWVNWTSKTHDWMNSWGYSQETGFWVSRSELYNTVFQTYSMAGMVPAFAFTTAAMSATVPTPLIVHAACRSNPDDC